MPDGIRWVGVDVYARESTLAIFDQATGELARRRVGGRRHELLPWLRAVAKPARMVYEAGPTGYGLARRARAEGIELGVCAPGKTERPPADRVKTDKRDAIRLARLLAAGELTLVTIPSLEREQLRDLVRCREDIRQALMRARHRIGKFLLRREIYWEGTGEAWSRKHRSWLTSVRFADQASRATLADYLHAYDVLIARRDQVEAELAKSALSAPCARTVARLRCLRGIDTLSALGLCSEIGEWGRFDHPDQLSAYLGIVPSEPPSGSQRRLGSITRAGSTHARRLLVEASYHYRPGRARHPGDGHTHHSQETHQLALTLSLNTSRCGWRGGPSIPARAQQLRDSSPEQRPPGAALDNRQRTCDEQRSWGTQPPNMSITTVANPRTPGPPRKPQPNQPSPPPTRQWLSTPTPLTPAPPYGRHTDRAPGGANRAWGAASPAKPLRLLRMHRRNPPPLRVRSASGYEGVPAGRPPCCHSDRALRGESPASAIVPTLKRA